MPGKKVADENRDIKNSCRSSEAIFTHSEFGCFIPWAQ
jgi:hypothetical protein